MRIYWAVSLTFAGALFVGGSAVAGTLGAMGYEGVTNAKCTQYVSTNVGVRRVAASNCSPRMINHRGAGDPLAAVHTYNSVPYGYLKTFTYKNTPNVNVMRVHSRAPVVGLNDAPNGFSGGCSPVSTSYCRSRKAAPPPVYAKAPAPIIRARPAPVYKMQPPAPVFRARPVPVYKMQPPKPQILCRRPAPRPVPVTVQVVRPIIGVPYPVPTPIALPRPSPCGGPVMTAYPAYQARIPGHIPIMAGGRWSY
ncbi:MAG: hypothetical protein COA91_02090 [Robiginitomaculum sp.]|nr:MAG: hypothetical protein COA91_02090 [Robiginitomaculum sp.]